MAVRVAGLRERDHRRQAARGAVGDDGLGAAVRVLVVEPARAAGPDGCGGGGAAALHGEAVGRARRGPVRRCSAGADAVRGADVPVRQPGRAADAAAGRRGLGRLARRRRRLGAGVHLVAGRGRVGGRVRVPHEDGAGAAGRPGARAGVPGRGLAAAADPGRADGCRGGGDGRLCGVVHRAARLRDLLAAAGRADPARRRAVGHPAGAADRPDPRGAAAVGWLDARHGGGVLDDERHDAPVLHGGSGPGARRSGGRRRARAVAGAGCPVGADRRRGDGARHRWLGGRAAGGERGVLLLAVPAGRSGHGGRGGADARGRPGARGGAVRSGRGAGGGDARDRGVRGGDGVDRAHRQHPLGRDGVELVRHVVRFVRRPRSRPRRGRSGCVPASDTAAPGDDGGPGAAVGVGGSGGVDGTSGTVPDGGGSGGPGSGSATSVELTSLLAATRSSSGTTWSAAVATSQTAASLELSSGTAVMATGGWSGSDSAVTLAGFRSDVEQGRIAYYVAGGQGGGPDRLRPVRPDFLTRSPPPRAPHRIGGARAASRSCRCTRWWCGRRWCRTAVPVSGRCHGDHDAVRRAEDLPPGLFADVVVELAHPAPVVELGASAVGVAVDVVEVADGCVAVGLGAPVLRACFHEGGEQAGEGALSGVAADDDAVVGEQAAQGLRPLRGGEQVGGDGSEAGDLGGEWGLWVEQGLDRDGDLDFEVDGGCGGLAGDAFDEGVGEDLSAGAGQGLRVDLDLDERLVQRGEAGGALFDRDVGGEVAHRVRCGSQGDPSFGPGGVDAGAESVGSELGDEPAGHGAEPSDAVPGQVVHGEAGVDLSAPARIEVTAFDGDRGDLRGAELPGDGRPGRRRARRAGRGRSPPGCGPRWWRRGRPVGPARRHCGGARRRRRGRRCRRFSTCAWANARMRVAWSAAREACRDSICRIWSISSASESRVVSSSRAWSTWNRSRARSPRGTRRPARRWRARVVPGSRSHHRGYSN
ncbi:hypothetical protein L7F22_000060 [Adiantum nelumboides]|nr:hypothetical protein [Adiantum nelumboides]